MLLLPTSITSTQELLSRQAEGFNEASQYLVQHTEPNDLYIDDDFFLTLTIKTGRPKVININAFYNSEFKDDVKNLGFKSAMEKYNVKYLIILKDTPNYVDFVDIFTDEELIPKLSERELFVLPIANSKEYSKYIEEDNRDSLIDKYNIKDKFVFEKQIGVYRFFRFKD